MLLRLGRVPPAQPTDNISWVFRKPITPARTHHRSEGERNQPCPHTRDAREETLDRAEKQIAAIHLSHSYNDHEVLSVMGTNSEPEGHLACQKTLLSRENTVHFVILQHLLKFRIEVFVGNDLVDIA
jgi:hypothetical protein